LLGPIRESALLHLEVQHPASILVIQLLNRQPQTRYVSAWEALGDDAHQEEKFCIAFPLTELLAWSFEYSKMDSGPSGTGLAPLGYFLQLHVCFKLFILKKLCPLHRICTLEK